MRVAVIGEFCSGKTTFINSILGETVLCSAAVPNTCFVNEVKWAPKNSARLHFTPNLTDASLTGVSEEIRQYVNDCDTDSPAPLDISYQQIENLIRLNIDDYRGPESVPFRKLEVFNSIAFLKNGIELLEIPYSENIMPPPEVLSADAIIFILDATRITDLSHWNLEAYADRLFMVVSKSDLLKESEQESLKELLKAKFSKYTSNEIFFVSAISSLEAVQTKNRELFWASGIMQFKNAFLNFAENRENRPEPAPEVQCTIDDKKEISLDDCINFANSLIQGYEWPDEIKEDFVSRIASVRQKQQDKLLNMCVVGEFGSGKSTMINALLRKENFLVSSALQGTTVAATVIVDSEGWWISAEKNDRTVVFKEFGCMEELTEGLVVFTTNPEIAKDLNSVHIGVPDTPLKDTFRIIDTPGTNSLDSWHEDVTVRAVQEMADIVLFVIDAGKPLPETFINFIRNNMDEILNRCVFAVTRIDIVPEDERKGVLRYLKSHISKKLGVESPVVIPYGALDILRNPDSQLAEESKESEKAILEYMKQRKESVQTGKLIELTDSLFIQLNTKMSESSQGYKSDMELLLKSQQAPLKPFIDEQIRKRTEEFSNAFNRQDFISSLEAIEKKFYDEIMGKVEEINKVDLLKKFVETQLSDFCRDGAQAMVDEALKRENNSIKKYRLSMKCFLEEFEELFNDLQVLKVNFRKDKLMSSSSAQMQVHNVTDANNYVNSSLKKQNITHIGGVAVGAAVGTAIVPGLGTVIGAGIGLLGGLFLGPDINKVKAETKGKLEAPLKEYFSEVKKGLLIQRDKYIKKLTQNVKFEINRYLDVYQNTVSERIRDEKQKISVIESNIERIDRDINNIKAHKQALALHRARLDS